MDELQSHCTMAVENMKTLRYPSPKMFSLLREPMCKQNVLIVLCLYYALTYQVTLLYYAFVLCILKMKQQTQICTMSN